MKFINSRLGNLVVVLILFAALLLPRAFSLTRFVAVDEVNWLHRSAIFYDAVVRHSWSETYINNSPGVITTWVGALAFRIAGPDFRVASDKIITSYGAFEEELTKVVGLNPIYVLALSRVIMISLLIAVLLICYFYAQRLFGILPSLIGFLIIALDPFLIALTRMSHLDAPQAIFMFLSILAFLNFLFRGNRWLDLAVSGIAGGFAFLAKLPGIFIVPTIGFVAFMDYLQNRSVDKVGISRFTGKPLKKLIQSLLAWAFVFIIAYVAVWPSMWVHPAETLAKVMDTSSRYASTIVDEYSVEEVVNTNSSVSQNVLRNLRYPRWFLWRTTPVVLLGLVLLGIVYYSRKNRGIDESAIKIVQGLLIFVIIYTIGITLPKKSSEKYFAPVYLVLDLLAGLGWYYGILLLSKSLKAVHRKYVHLVVMTVIFIFQSIWVFQSSPYYFTYYNPLMGGLRRAAQVKMIGVGEGLDLAGRYLMEKPNGSEIKVMAWYGIGPLSYFFDGTVFPLYMYNSNWTPDFIQRLRTMDYLVIYSNQKFRNQPPELFNILSDIKPEHTVTINGAEYAWIYKVSDIPLPDNISGHNQ